MKSEEKKIKMVRLLGQMVELKSFSITPLSFPVEKVMELFSVSQEEAIKLQQLPKKELLEKTQSRQIEVAKEIIENGVD